ncbi:YciI family protein [Dactylosporangium darangshiense]|uniref:YciI family protein n=1 Tax=Dactylosporangium darangshiense TaxID=579108 RepID=UPI00364580D0
MAIQASSAAGFSPSPGWRSGGARVYETLTDQQRIDFGLGHLRLREEMREAGVLVVSEGLGDPALATQVSVRDGRTITSDGPYAEVKEHLAGFYLIDVADLDEAVAWAAKAPDAAYTRVEVRPILDMSTWEL